MRRRAAPRVRNAVPRRGQPSRWPVRPCSLTSADALEYSPHGPLGRVHCRIERRPHGRIQRGHYHLTCPRQHDFEPARIRRRSLRPGNVVDPNGDPRDVKRVLPELEPRAATHVLAKCVVDVAATNADVQWRLTRRRSANDALLSFGDGGGERVPSLAPLACLAGLYALVSPHDARCWCESERGSETEE